MIVVMRTGASAEQIDEIKRTIEEHGLEAYVSRGEERTVIGVVGQGVERVEHIKQMPGVEQVIRVSKPYKLASREHHPDRSRVRVGDIDVGAGAPLRMMAGPCAVESHEQLLATARWVKREGAVALRGGAFKPRTCPYAFQGLGVEGLKLLARTREETGLPVVSEITDPADVEVFDRYVDMLQIGSRNMHNFVLLKAAGQSRKAVLLKRGFGATIEEWLMAAEYILQLGQPQRDPLRARHPHLRAVHAQHAGPDRGAGAPRADPPADHDRPVPRHRPPKPRAADGAGRGRRRRRRDHHRGPPRSAARPAPTPTRASRSPSSAT